MKRAWCQIVLKSVDEDQRRIEGIASTPSTDRTGDIVESQGAAFTLPLPFLWQHDSAQPIGHVIAAKPDKDGIPVTIQLADVPVAGALKDRLDEAWQSIKFGLVRGLSIGFAPLEYSYIEETGGYRFTKWNWLELSAVTIPANADASISNIKALDLATLRMPVVHRATKEDADDAKVSKFVERLAKNFDKEMRENHAEWKLDEKAAPTLARMRKAATHAYREAVRVTVMNVDRLIEDSGERFAAMEKRIKALEAVESSTKYVGVWQPSMTHAYRKGNFTSYAGNLWAVLKDSPEGDPGQSRDYQLAVKKGRDAPRSF